MHTQDIAVYLHLVNHILLSPEQMSMGWRWSMPSASKAQSMLAFFRSSRLLQIKVLNRANSVTLCQQISDRRLTGFLILSIALWKGWLDWLICRFDVGYTDYIRTTEERHAEAVKNVWLALEVRHLLVGSKLGVSHFFSFKEERWPI